jgi:heparan-alpha-glucosaminide N-acetyltransferase
MAGFCGWGLLLFYFLVDIKQIPYVFNPLLWMGMNAIVVFVGGASDVLNSVLGLVYYQSSEANAPQWNIVNASRHYLLSWMGEDPAGLMYTLFKIVFWYLVSFVLYKKKIFIKI